MLYTLSKSPLIQIITMRNIDVIRILFGWEVSNDTYVDYLIEEPEEEYHGEEWESLEHWELRKKVETYLVNEFPDWEYVLFKICW